MGSRAAVLGSLIRPPIVTCTTSWGCPSSRPCGEPKWTGPGTRCPAKLAPDPVGELKLVGTSDTRDATADTGSGAPALMPATLWLTKSGFVASAGDRKMRGRLLAHGHE